MGDVDILTKRAAERASPNVSMRWRWIEISPSAHSLSELARLLSVAPKKQRLTIAEALRLSPRDTLAYIWMHFAGVAKIPWALRAGGRVVSTGDRGQPKLSATHIFGWPPPCAQLGRLDEARSAVKAGLALDPTFAISRARAAWTAMSDDPTYLAQLEPILEGMRKAGVPEQ